MNRTNIDTDDSLFPESTRPLLLLGLCIGVAVSIALAVVLTVGVPRAGAIETIGAATLRLADGSTAGTVTFQQEPDALVTRVKVSLKLSPSATGFHGLHLHANNDPVNGIDCSADPRSAASTRFVSADGHWRRGVNDGHPNHAGVPAEHLGEPRRPRKRRVRDRPDADG